MSDVKWIKIVTDIFDDEKIQEIEVMPDGDRTFLTWLYLYSKAKRSRRGEFEFMLCPGFLITDDVLSAIVYPHSGNEAPAHVKRLEALGLVERRNDRIVVIPPWKRDRTSPEYSAWRRGVFARDGYSCQSCGTKTDLQAHHIVSWKSDKALRFSLENGVTLCRKCHLKAHGGCWKNG